MADLALGTEEKSLARGSRWP